MVVVLQDTILQGQGCNQSILSNYLTEAKMIEQCSEVGRTESFVRGCCGVRCAEWVAVSTVLGKPSAPNGSSWLLSMPSFTVTGPSELLHCS